MVSVLSNLELEYKPIFPGFDIMYRLTLISHQDKKLTILLFSLFLIISLITEFGLAVILNFSGVSHDDPLTLLKLRSGLEDDLKGIYYLLGLSHLALAAGILSLGYLFAFATSAKLVIGTMGGVLFAVMQSMVFFRWAFVIPFSGHSEIAITQSSNLVATEQARLIWGLEGIETLSLFGLAIWLFTMASIFRAPEVDKSKLASLWGLAGILTVFYILKMSSSLISFLAPLLLVFHGLVYSLIVSLIFVLTNTNDESEKLEPLTFRQVLFCFAVFAVVTLSGLQKGFS